MLSSHEDDRLLERLGQALVASSLEPAAHEVDRIRAAAEERSALGRSIDALGDSLGGRRPTEVARAAADVRAHLRRWEAMLGAQDGDRLVTEARQLLRQARRFLRSLPLPPAGADGLSSSFL